MRTITTLLLVVSTTFAEKVFSSVKRKAQDSQWCEGTNSETPGGNSSCWNYNIGEDTTQKGCANPSCEAAVCECDPYCCSKSWDINCRGNIDIGFDNYFTPGCSASKLCCEDITAYTPPEGTSMVLCPGTDDVFGYDSVEGLTEDMMKDYNAKKKKGKYEYILCPGTTFDMTGMSTSKLPTILKSKTVIQCGKEGLRTDECVFFGGEHQIIFHPDLNVKNVLIKGLTFTRAQSTSIVAWGKSKSNAVFEDCYWEGNYGYTLIDVYPSIKDYGRRELKENASTSTYEHSFKARHSFASLSLENQQSAPHEHRTLRKVGNYDIDLMQERVQVAHERKLQDGSDFDSSAMTVSLKNSLLSGNQLSTGLVISVGGIVEVTKSTFALNTNSAVGIGISDGGTLILDTDTDFVKNENGFSTIFLDAESNLKIVNKNPAGATASSTSIGQVSESNDGVKCDGIFVESEGSGCLITGGFETSCYGICCDFQLVCILV